MFLKKSRANETFLDGLHFRWYRFQVIKYCLAFVNFGFVFVFMLFLRVSFVVFLMIWQ